MTTGSPIAWERGSSGLPGWKLEERLDVGSEGGVDRSGAEDRGWR
jgi:hypothetical protein